MNKSRPCRARDKANCRTHGGLPGLPRPHAVRREGLSENQIEAYRREAANARERLTKDEVDRLKAYSHLGFMAVNNFLHRPAHYEGRDGRLRREVAELDAALAKAPVAAKPRALYRAVRIRQGQLDGSDSKAPLTEAAMEAYIAEKYPVGKRLNMPSYSSTTADSDYVLMFTKRRPADYIIYEILTDKGLAHDDPEDRGNNIQSYEREVLLPRDMKFEVVNVTRATYELSDPEKFDAAWIFGRTKCSQRYHVVQMREIG